jgi:hypothetical protein
MGRGGRESVCERVEDAFQLKVHTGLVDIFITLDLVDQAMYNVDFRMHWFMDSSTPAAAALQKSGAICGISEISIPLTYHWYLKNLQCLEVGEAPRDCN